MKNQMAIKVENKRETYLDFGTLLDDFNNNDILKYFLEVNSETVEITPAMALNISMFFDEYKEYIISQYEANRLSPPARFRDIANGE